LAPLSPTPLFIDINAPEFLILLVLAIVLFGPERLPDLARKVSRVVRYLRTIAGSAQDQLSKELGPGFEDLDFRDLNPKAFVQKHLLSDVEPLVADVKREITEAGSTIAATALPGRADGITDEIESVKDVDPGGPHNLMAMATPTHAPFDTEAT
jgi:sec-independent protein translocase protein TatB